MAKFENENLPRDITLGSYVPLPLFRYTLYVQSLSMFIRTFSFQPLWVILCHLPETGRKEIVNEMTERDREAKGAGNESKETEKN